jgi:hypothetical protein
MKEQPSCVIQPGDAATGTVDDVLDLPSGDALIGAEKGLFRYDPTRAGAVPVSGAATGSVDRTHHLPDGDVLIHAEKGWFRYDQLHARVVPVGDVRAGSLDYGDMHDLPDGGVLIHAERGWFRYDPPHARMVPVGDVPTGSVSYGDMHDLPGGGVLIRGEKGWFRYDLTQARVVPADDAPTGNARGHSVQYLPGGGVLIGTEKAWFRYDPTQARIVPVRVAATGSVDNLHDLPGGDVLIHAKKGWFRYDPAQARMVPIGDVAMGAVDGLHNLPSGGVLIHAEKGWFVYDPAQPRMVPIGDVATGNASNRMHDLPGGAVLIRAEKGWFRYDPTQAQVVPAGDAKTPAKYENIEADMHDVSGGGVLIRTEQGLFRYDPAQARVVPASDAATGFLYDIHDLPGGGVLIHAEKGWFRYDPVQARVVPASDGITVYRRTDVQADMHDLPDGGVLIGTRRGLFRYDPTRARVSASDEATGTVNDMGDLPGGGVLINAEKGWFRYDSARARVVPAGDTGTMDARDGPDDMHGLPGGGVLIRADKGFLAMPTLPLSAARVKLETNLSGLPLDREVQIRLSFVHPCAQVSDHLGLTLAALSPGGTTRAGVSVHFPEGTHPIKDKAILAAPIIFDVPGEWVLQLQQGLTAVGERMSVSIAGPSIVEQLVSAWQIIVGIVFALYITIFALLLFATRYSTRAFAILNDPVWAKRVFWPFFFLRHIRAVQCWVLEPSFRKVRAAKRLDARFVDPPISSSKSEPMPASSLLHRLRERPRLWLQGRSGMGKTSVFAAWESAYFASPDAKTLRAATRQHGFILVMLPMRHFARPPPDPNKPETWVLDAVRRRFEELDFATDDLRLIKAMLRSGHIALAMDGANEADCDDALAAFARQFPRVRILVTSQSTGDETWEVWRLPETVEAMRDQLLIEWLGKEAAAILSRRIVDEGLSEVIASGYDLALIRDLAGVDPEGTKLPGDRIVLYRTMLARVQDTQGRMLRLERLEQIAWTMVMQRRREITSEDEKLLGETVLAALDCEGVRIVSRIGNVREFRHDQMRAFLAALWLAEEMPIAAAQRAAVDGGAFSINPRDEEELWRFFALLISSEDKLKEHWVSSEDKLQQHWAFACEEPKERGTLMAAIQAEADKRDIILVRHAQRRYARSAAAGS